MTHICFQYEIIKPMIDRKKYLENDPDKIIKRIMERRKTVPGT